MMTNGISRRDTFAMVRVSIASMGLPLPLPHRFTGGSLRQTEMRPMADQAGIPALISERKVWLFPTHRQRSRGGPRVSAPDAASIAGPAGRSVGTGHRD